MQKGLESLMKFAEDAVKELKKEDVEELDERIPEVQEKLKEVKEKIEKQKERYGRISRNA